MQEKKIKNLDIIAKRKSEKIFQKKHERIV